MKTFHHSCATSRKAQDRVALSEKLAGTRSAVVSEGLRRGTTGERYRAPYQDNRLTLTRIPLRCSEQKDYSFRQARAAPLWIPDASFLWLAVPSAIVPEEHNVLINPRPPRMRDVSVVEATRSDSIAGSCSARRSRRAARTRLGRTAIPGVSHRLTAGPLGQSRARSTLAHAWHFQSAPASFVSHVQVSARGVVLGEPEGGSVAPRTPATRSYS